jgi:hypothetical protein
MQRDVSHLGLRILVPLAMLVAGCSSASLSNDDLGTAALRLDAEDCLAGSQNGKVGICHATGSASNPYVHVRVSTNACINGHARHPGDFVSEDPSCRLCVPTSCAAQNKNCGTIPDGCGASLECGSCAAPQTCNTDGRCATQQWLFSATASPTVERGGYEHYFRLTVLKDGSVLITGGFDGQASETSAELYDPHQGEWNTASNMTSRRIGHTATLLADGRVLVAGGQSADGGVLSSAEIYQPSTGSWTPIAGLMTQPRIDHEAVLLKDGRVLLMAGRWTDTAEVFDPVSATFTSTGQMLRGRSHPEAVRLPDGRVLVTAGSDDLVGCEIYDPATNSWSPTGSMVQGRYEGFHLVSLADGRVLTAGGNDRGGVINGRAEIYDPAQGSWSLTADLPASWEWYEVLLLDDGRVLLAGGSLAFSLSATTDRALLFDPASQTWTPTAGPMTTPRALHSSVKLGDGRGLFVGGANSAGVLNSAELYQPTWL